MSTPLTLLYRGPLASCNFRCDYCSFSSRREVVDDLPADRAALRRLVDTVARRREHRVAVFFTPSGEALVHDWYQDAIIELTQLPQVTRVAIQTNLSGPLAWLARGDARRVGVWATYHPRHATRDAFLAQCAELRRRAVRFSVGVVGLPAFVDEIERLRAALPSDVYLWVNAARRDPAADDPALVRRLTAIDPLFPFNLRPQSSRGRPCRCGQRVVAVDGAGAVRRCFFLPQIIGRLEEGFERALSVEAAPCPAETCRCHIGYVHLVPLGLDRVFGDGVLERVPVEPIWLAGARQP
jgi:hypothetical protein